MLKYIFSRHNTIWVGSSPWLRAWLHCNDTGRLYRASQPKFNFSLKHEAAFNKMHTNAHVRVEDLKAWTDV